MFETGLLLAGVAALMLPKTFWIAAVSLILVLWVLARPPRQERLFVTLGLVLVLVLLAVSTLASRWPSPAPEVWGRELATGFGAVWQDLQETASQAAVSFESSPELGGDHRAEFERLEAQVAASSIRDDLTLLLLNPAGGIVAWAGQGLRHTIDSVELPASGFAFRRGYSATTIFAVEPLPVADEEPAVSRRPWRLVAGRSLEKDRLPFDISVTTTPRVPRWAFGPADAPAVEGVLKLDLGDAPTLFLISPTRLDPSSHRLAQLAEQVAIGFFGLTLLALALLRATGSRLLPEGTPLRRSRGVPLLALGGTLALGIAGGFPPLLTGALAAAVGLAAWGLVRPRIPDLRPTGGALGGGLAAGALVVAASFYQHYNGIEDLSTSLSGAPDTVALCLVWCLAALGLLSLSSRRQGPIVGDALAWWSTALLVAAGAACDFPWIALPLLLAAGAAAGRWWKGIHFGRRPMALGGLLVLSALIGSVSWEISYREVFRRQLADHYLPLVSPPTRDEMTDLHLEIHEYLESRDVAHLQAPLIGPMDPQDLAFVLWRDSPLPQHDALSALVIETRSGERSSFSFGLALDDDLEFVLPAERWDVPAVAEWNRKLILDRAELLYEGQSWGVATYWFLPRPGFRFDVNEIAELDEALLRGGLHVRPVDGLPRGVLYSLHDESGRAISSPWGEAPPLPLELLEGDPAPPWLDTPDGRSWVFWRTDSDGIEVLYLPQLTLLAGLERVGTHALGSLAWVTGIALLALIFALPGSAIRELMERTLRSYSKRMILVYTLLLLGPLIALNLVLLQSFSDRERREQRAVARGALDSARLFLVDYFRGLPFGFDLKAKVDRALMEWISSVVEHPVNFYWRSEVLESSQQELFTIGLLPRRIPGEVFSRLALSGNKMGFRQNRGDVGYLELYAPLEIDGEIIPGLFLSVPVLEQEEEVARELEALRQRAVLVTSALMMLLFAVGSRLARSFTEPLMDLVEGTRRIAAGATFLDVAPREQELEALADAIDDMARRIAEGRRQLVLEKEVVERMVENIRSGVLSLDRDRRVLLQNRVAADFLGTEIGETVEKHVQHEPRLQPIADFLETTGGAIQQATLKLDDEAGEAREWALTWVPIPGADDPAALLVVDDATEVLRAERLEAWAEMARIIAHEIKNPLTPIRLSADHMRQVYREDSERFDEVFERCTNNILRQVEELADIASDFSIYSRIPKAERVEGDLVAALEELIGGYLLGEAADQLIFTCELPELQTRFDPKLLMRAVRNVLENALRASDGRGKVELALTTDNRSARIRVLDSGPGVEPGLLRRIFEPYFSTYDSGTGLGLAITRRIVEEHAGVIEAVNRTGGGLKVAITIPLA